MKIGKTVITIRREVGKTLHDEVDTVLREIVSDPTHEFRKLIAHTSRSSAKDFMDVQGEGQLAERLFVMLAPRLIDLLTSHTPGLTPLPTTVGTVTAPAEVRAGLPADTLPALLAMVTPAPLDPAASTTDVPAIPDTTPLKPTTEDVRP